MTMTTTIHPTITADHAATGSARRRVRALTGALRSEWIKVSTLRSNQVMLASTAVVGAGIAGALAATATDDSVVAAEWFIYPLPLVSTLAIVTGILAFTGEAQHGTLPVTLAAQPARWVTVTAKAAMATMVGVAYGLVAMVAGFAGAIAGGAEAGIGSAVVSRAAWALLYIALSGLVGLGVGMIVRHSAGAVSGLLMWAFVIENLFAPALPDGVRHFLPFSAGYRLLDAGPSFETPVRITHELSRPVYAAIFGGFAVISLMIGTVLLYHRDTD